MNAFDQLQAIRATMEARGASAETLRVLDRAIAMAEPQKDSPLNIPQAMVLKHLLRMPDALNSHVVEQDLLGLAGDIEERWRPPAAEEVADATVDSERHIQHSHTYYREKKRQSRAGEK
ncbi:MAG: hypothetical protein NVSMB65_15930 [Chloroflexota bacterium]